MTRIQKRKIGLLIGGSLLVTGGGLATSFATTSCKNDKGLGLTFDNCTAQYKSDVDENPDYFSFALSIDVGGLSNDEFCTIATTKDDLKPNRDLTNVWLPTLSDDTKGMFYGTLAGEELTVAYYPKEPANVNLTFNHVWAMRSNKNGKTHSDWYEIKDGLTFQTNWSPVSTK